MAYDRAIEINPEFAIAWHSKGVSLECLSRHNEALVAFERALEINPDLAQAWHGKEVTLKKPWHDQGIACGFRPEA